MNKIDNKIKKSKKVIGNIGNIENIENIVNIDIVNNDKKDNLTNHISDNSEQEKITKSTNIALTPTQTKIYDDLVEFVKKPNSNEIILVGYAGTGKTTLVTKLINDLIKTKLCKKITIVAPTHKAVNIAKSKLFSNIEADQELSKNINIMTVHRLLNYQSYIDSNSGEKYFAKSKIDPNWTIYDLIVVDECSMLSNQIIRDISDQLAKVVNSQIKIIYVGDPAQLPPVSESDSQIFNREIKKLTLDKIVRTKNSQIMDLSNDHRIWISSKKDSDIPNVFKYQSEKINIYSNQNKETTKWLDNFIKLTNKTNDNENKEDNKEENKQIDISSFDNNIILTWTNKKCNNYNQYVRQKLFNKKNLEHFEVGEILIFNDFHRYIQEIPNINNQENPDNNINPDNIDDDNIKKQYISFYTSEQVKLIQIEKTKYKLEPIKFKINSILTTELNEKFKLKILAINDIINIELDTYILQVKRMSDVKSNEPGAPLHTIYTIHPTSEKLFASLIEQFENLILKLRKSCYKLIEESKKDNMIKCNLQGEVDKKLNKLYRDWQSNVTDKFAQLNYGYSITVHKSQGSTFKNVFVDISDILENNNIEETSKCLYTAITRSSNSLELLI
jgi:hypothetical protein